MLSQSFEVPDIREETPSRGDRCVHVIMSTVVDFRCVALVPTTLCQCSMQSNKLECEVMPPYRIPNEWVCSNIRVCAQMFTLSLMDVSAMTCDKLC